LIFHFPASESTFYRQWWAIQEAAGISEDRWIKLHDLKRACGTRFAKIASPWVVQQRMDHSSITTSQAYINATDEEHEAVDRLPLPAAFRGHFAQPIAGAIG
jgi:integrase